LTEYQSPRKEREDRANRILLAGVVGLVVLALVAVAFASLKPAGKVKVPTREENTIVVAPAPKPPAATRPMNSPDSAQTTAPVSSQTPKPNTPTNAAPTEATVPEMMTALPAGTRQIIIITGDKIGSNSGHLALYNKAGTGWTEVMNVAANFGKNGLIDGEKRRQGNLQTPTGIWTIGSFLFGLHPSPPAGTLMRYRPITADSYWSSVRDSTYNTWVGHRVSGEHLIDSDPQYEYAFNTGYNSPPNERVIGRGTAIFIHCFEPPDNSLGKYTHGCVAISRENMIELFTRLDPAQNPACAIGTLVDGSPTSIWAY
jgi:L,D-peptidoglycan transpeptidase YkuD (ErfK/YbiS/YcfS/YnhG family)